MLWARWDPVATFGRYSLMVVSLAATALAFGLLAFVIRPGYPLEEAPNTYRPSGWSDYLRDLMRYHTTLDLSYVDFKNVRSFDAHYLEGANLYGAKFDPDFDEGDIYLQNADLEFARLDFARLEGANFDRANLNAAHLNGSTLTGATFINAYMWNAQLEKVIALGADFQRARLIRANLRDANLRGANLSGADLKNADFEGADLLRATLGAQQLLSACTLYQAKLDDSVKDMILSRKKELLDQAMRNDGGQCCDEQMQESQHCWQH